MSGVDAPTRPNLPTRLGAWVMGLPPVRWLKPILDDYDAAGGGLLASGLAYSFLFALLPAILLVVSLLGLLLADSAQLERVIDELAARFPPLAEFFRTALEGVRSQAVSFGILGLIGLMWGSSYFYQSLDNAIARIFHGSPRRDAVQRGIRGVVSVLLLIGAVTGAVIVVSFADGYAAKNREVGWAVTLLTSALGSLIGTVLIFAAALALIYRMVPTDTPSWRAIRLPAAVIGTAVALFTALFAVIAPRLVGGLRVYGAFIAVFAAMIWLSYVSQAILVGAAWVRRRARAAQAAAPTG